jgi:DNA-binding ferritin-like protein
MRKKAVLLLNGVVGDLFDLYARINVRSAIKKLTEEDDFRTAGLLTDVVRDLDKQLWILEAHQDKK